eukprot:CAMPEP_0202728404 /NCGR_PEP_ID=MMETSP1385-20130828/185610_1 /ASSEMBLY_ACC=CAM_ASM_000861 /TAXON_ID=933848 /ORGANISM="Elphidium margaritaceum" /LENGTH=313 /DNA_ID=CAMNT_0049394651 /DNA_START=710 /DNA_END=1652 /DNA_ORIENTATION=+
MTTQMATSAHAVNKEQAGDEKESAKQQQVVMEAARPISIEEFNALPDVYDAWKSINSSKTSFLDVLDNTVGEVMAAHKLESTLSAVLNHMHYPLEKGQKQVIVKQSVLDYDSDSSLDSVSDCVVSECVAEPVQLDDTLDLIPVKWRLNCVNNKQGTYRFESYEYLSTALAQDVKLDFVDKVALTRLKKCAHAFEADLALQKELAQAILQSGMEKYIGVLLRVLPSRSSSVELTNENDRQSVTTVFVFKEDAKHSHPLMDKMLGIGKNSKKEVVQTSWDFEKDINAVDICVGKAITAFTAMGILSTDSNENSES